MNQTRSILLALTVALCTLPVVAQDTASVIAPGCGNMGARFKVTTTDNTNLPPLEAGKARLYFIQDNSNIGFDGPTTMAGVDGQWIGAMQDNSFLYASIDPGEHHLCASWQSGPLTKKGRYVAAAHLTAEAGGNYYFLAKNTSTEGSARVLTFHPIDSDEGKLLVNQYQLSLSTPK